MPDGIKSSADVLIAFLGAPARYDEVSYVLGEKEYRTPYCPDALTCFLRPKRLVLLVTETARHAESNDRNNLLDLTQRAEEWGCEVYDVSIPDAPFPEVDFDHVLWELFNINVAQIQPRERVAFDITFGYRFLPILTIVIGQFLKYAKDVETVGIYYGAREAAGPGDRTPIINLKVLSDLMSWTQAAAHFEQTGNAVPFIERRQGIDDVTLEQAWRHLEEVSLGLRLGLATRVGHSAAQLMTTLGNTPSQGHSAALPLRTLFDQIKEKYGPLAIEDNFTWRNANKHLHQQALLIAWYVENQQAIQAVLLAREWLVTWSMLGLNFRDLLDWGQRQATTRLLNNAAHTGAVEEDNGDPGWDNADTALFFKRVQEAPTVATLWKICTVARNQLAHMSMDYRARPMSDLLETLEQIAQGIRELALHLEVDAHNP